MQRQNAVSAYFEMKQILPYDFTEQDATLLSAAFHMNYVGVVPVQYTDRQTTELRVHLRIKHVILSATH